MSGPAGFTRRCADASRYPYLFSRWADTYAFLGQPWWLGWNQPHRSRVRGWRKLKPSKVVLINARRKVVPHRADAPFYSFSKPLPSEEPNNMQLLDVKTYKLERIVIDEEFSALVQPLDPKELAQLEENIRRDGIREPLSIWMADGTTPTLLDGHNRRVIAETLGMAEVPVHYVKLPDRDAALLWIEENQAGRRNLTDDQRAMIWASILQRRSKASRAAQLEQARQTKAGPASVEAKIAPTEKNVYSVEVKSTTPPGALTVYAPTS